jgi:hypothetical protein
LLFVHGVEFRITDDGKLEVLTAIPKVTFKSVGSTATEFDLKGLSVEARASGIGSARVRWAFEDDGDFQEGLTREHTFSRPGRHSVRLRVEDNGRLSELRGRLAVSRDHELVPPLTAVPVLAVANVEGSGADLRVELTGSIDTPDGGPPITAMWRIGPALEVQRGVTAKFEDLGPGKYTLTFTAMRALEARIYGHQRHNPETTFDISGLNITTNRTFDASGTESTAESNALTKHLFDEGTISPIDTWTLELSTEDNPFLRSVTQSDAEEIDVSEIADAILSLEYETAAG